MKSLMTFMLFLVASFSFTGEALAQKKFNYNYKEEMKAVIAYCDNRPVGLVSPCYIGQMNSIRDDIIKTKKKFLSWQGSVPEAWWTALRNHRDPGAFSSPVMQCVEAKPYGPQRYHLECYYTDLKWYYDHYDSLSDPKWKKASAPSSNMLGDRDVAAKMQSSQNYLDSIKSTPPSDDDYGD